MNNNVNNSNIEANNNSTYDNAQNNIDNSQPNSNNNQNTFNNLNNAQDNTNNLGMNNQNYNGENNQQSFFGNSNPNNLFSQNTSGSNSLDSTHNWNQNPLNRTVTIIITSIVSIIVLLTLVIPSYRALNHMDGGHHNLSGIAKSLGHSSNSSNDSSHSDSDDDDDEESATQEFKQASHQKGDWNFKAVHPSHQDYVNEDPDMSHVKPWTDIRSARIYNQHADEVALGMYKRLQGDYESDGEKMKIQGHHINIENSNGSASKMYITGVYEDQHVGLILSGAELHYWSKHDKDEESVNDVIIANQQNNGIELNDGETFTIQPLSDVDEPAPENNKYLASNLVVDNTDFHKVSQFDM